MERTMGLIEGRQFPSLTWGRNERIYQSILRFFRQSISTQHRLWELQLNSLRVLCGPLRLCVEYCVLLLQYTILNAKTQRTAKHAKDIPKKGRPRRDAPTGP